jgi:outer membrane receptor protein involved in Fe transport
MTMSGIKALWLFVLLFSFFAARSQTVADSVKKMDDVVVTATRKSTAVASLPYSVNSLSKNTIQRQLSRTVPESLNGIPGLFIQKTNHGGGSPFLRGLTGNQSLVLVDGVRLNNSIFRYGPNQYMTLIDPYIVEKIEVVKGTGSVQHGSDAMTGVINIQTTALQLGSKPQWQEKALIRMSEAGMELTVRPEIKYEGKKFAFVIGASSKKFGDLKGGDTTGFQRPTGYNEMSYDMKLKIDLGSNWNMTAAYHWLNQDNVPVFHKYRLENFAVNTSDPLKRGFGYVQAQKIFKSTFFKQLDIFVAEQMIGEQRYSRKNGSQMLRFEKDKARTVSGGADLLVQFNKIWDANTGVEAYNDFIESKRNDVNGVSGSVKQLRGLYPDNATYANFSIYNLHHLNLGRLRAEAGMRLNFYAASLTDTTIGTIRISPSAAVFQGGLNYQVLKSVFLYANISDGFRAPNIDDLGTLGIVDFRYEIPAYDLKPERSVNTEIGLKIITKKISFSSALFKTNLFGLITRVSTGASINGYQVYKKINVDRGFIKGWETQFGYKLFRGLSIYGNATSLFGESVTRSQPLRRIPPFNARLGTDFTSFHWTAGLTFDHASPQRRLDAGDKADNRIPAGGTPGFNLLNLYSGYQHKSLTFRLYWNNIFNADFRTHGSGVNGMGSAVSGMLIFSINQKNEKGRS